MTPPAANLNLGTPTAVCEGRLGSDNRPGEPDMPEKRLSVLYLFAGPKHKGDMRDHLSRAGQARGVEVKTVEYDVLRNRRQDLTKLALRRTIRTQVEQGTFDVVMASPRVGPSPEPGNVTRGPRPSVLRSIREDYPG